MIDADVLTRVRAMTTAEQIAWAVIVNNGQTQKILTLMLALQRADHFENLDALFLAEAALVNCVRTAARHANFALDTLDDEVAPFRKLIVVGLEEGWSHEDILHAEWLTGTNRFGHE